MGLDLGEHEDGFSGQLGHDAERPVVIDLSPEQVTMSWSYGADEPRVRAALAEVRLHLAVFERRGYVAYDPHLERLFDVARDADDAIGVYRQVRGGDPPGASGARRRRTAVVEEALRLTAAPGAGRRDPALVADAPVRYRRSVSAASPPSVRVALPVRWGRIVLLAALYAVLAGVQAFALRIVHVEAFEADGPSMLPTLEPEDRFVVDRGAYGLTLPFAREQAVHWADPVAGEVVVLRSPADEIDVVKRVIGVAGDRIEIRGGEVYRNGASLTVGPPRPCESEDAGFEPPACIDEAIGDRRWTTLYTEPGYAAAESMPELVVPQGTVFVLGDHRDRSNDSRNPRVGTVSVGRLRGPALLVYWGARSERRGTWIR